MKTLSLLLSLFCLMHTPRAVQAQQSDTVEKRRPFEQVVRLPSPPRITVAAYYERIAGTNVESAGGAIGLFFGGQRYRINGRCVDSDGVFEISRNRWLVECSLSRNAMALNFGFVPLHRQTCLFGKVGYAVKASYLLAQQDLQGLENRKLYWGVRLEGTAFWISPFLAGYMSFGDDYHKIAVFGVGVRL